MVIRVAKAKGIDFQYLPGMVHDSELPERAFDLVLFDLDGTLIATAGDAGAASNWRC